MDRADDPATAFAIKILREHPQIAYEHAVSAASYAGVTEMSTGAFFGAVDRLQIQRADPDERAREERAEVGAKAAQPTADAAMPPSSLVQALDELRAEVGETARIREALLKMREVVREALAETESAG